MELMDIYDEERQRTGRTMERSQEPAPGDHRTVVHLCVFNAAGELLIQRRSEEKFTYPLRWDVTAAGAVAAGETSRQAAERELREELGYSLSLSGVRPVMTVNFPGGFDDFFVVEREISLQELTLQTCAPRSRAAGTPSAPRRRSSRWRRRPAARTRCRRPGRSRRG